MVTGELKARVDRIWDAFWSGGIANPLEVMEQITYLLFIRRLDDLQIAAENRTNRLGGEPENPSFPPGDDETGAPYEDLRWSRLKSSDPRAMFEAVSERVFPFLRRLGGDGSTYSQHMRDARFTIPTPALLARVVDMIDELPMEGRDTKGDVYEYMLSKIATAGQNGQRRSDRPMRMVWSKSALWNAFRSAACGSAPTRSNGLRSSISQHSEPWVTLL